MSLCLYEQCEHILGTLRGETAEKGGGGEEGHVGGHCDWGW